MIQIRQTTEKPSSRLPRYNGKPQIFFQKPGKYPVFCIQDIYNSLFIGTKNDPDNPNQKPLIHLSGENKRRRKDLLSFILPEEICNSINVKDHHYKEFFLISPNNNKITKQLFEIFSANNSSNSENLFIESIQNHFIKQLQNAEYNHPELNKYLSDLCDNAIVPVSISAEANAAFHSLIDTTDRNTISKVVANIFISSMLGLYSMRYNDQFFLRTYLLNKLGMDFIWLPPGSITTQYLELHNAQAAFENGNYGDAYTSLKNWLSNPETITNKELSKAYYLLGVCLYFHPELCSQEPLEIKQQEAITFLEKCVNYEVEKPETYDAHFILFEYYRSKNAAKAFVHLKTAFDHNCTPAVVEVARQFLDGKNVLNDIRDDQIIKKLSSIIESEQYPSEVISSECLYLRGRFLKRAGEERNAESYFKLAAEKGHEKSRQELSRRKRKERQHFPSFSENFKSHCCVVNSLTGNNLTFLSTMPDGEWSLFTTEQCTPPSGIFVHHINDLNAFIQSRVLTDELPKILFLFMSEDEDKNLNNCLMLLDQLFNIALELSEKGRNDLIDCTDIYVKARFETASMLIDANISDMGDIYFKVHIADEPRDAIHQLLCEAPLFIPYLNIFKKEKSSNIVLLGSTETNYRFIKESMASAYLGTTHPITVTLLGKDADRLEKRLHQECPGLYHEPHIRCIRPVFIPCCIEEANFPSYIYGNDYKNSPEDTIVQALKFGNYFVVDLENDYDSIRFAMELRTWLLRSGDSFNRAPFIAVKCSNSHSYLAAHLTLSGQAAGNTYYNRYDLFPFGMARSLYSYQRLVENPHLEDVALRIHKSYYGQNERQAENDYYSFSYNADSSLLTAIGLSYRLFAGGAFFQQKEQYHNFGVFESTYLYSVYVDSIKKKSNQAAALEQSRWNGFMLSRGWESADASRVQAYKEQSTGSSHKHTLAKLHPMIREWDDLDSDDMTAILGLLKSKFNYNKSPKEITQNSIKDTFKFVSNFIENDRECVNDSVVIAKEMEQ